MQQNPAPPITALPIDAVIPDIQQALRSNYQLVLEAPPGAGKTTRVPLALYKESWLKGKKIIMLEPRRLAAKSSAERMASQLGEAVGNTVGYRIRMENKVSASTRIEVVTEGILTRMLQQDPSLAEVGLVIFDEFHERNLHGDLALALLLQGRSLFRDDDPLRILVMSATLDGEQIAQLLAVDEIPAQRISSLGKAFPVAVEYGDAFQFGEWIEPRVLKAIKSAIEEQSGSILVFLPGQAEIRRVAADLQSSMAKQPDANGNTLSVTPLYGDLDFAAQRAAIAPAPAGVRKIVLATSIAETSITIDGVTVVIDSGLQREPVFDPRTAMTRLETKRCSRAASEQRAGRAGRTAPGICYRLWSESQHQQLAAFAKPEILNTDLSALALQLLQWGIDQPSDLQWIDTPPSAAFNQACDLLEKLGAVTQEETTANNVTTIPHYRITAHGESISRLGAHPRLAHMMVRGAELGVAKMACDIAALLTERNPLRADQADITDSLRALRNGDNRFKRIKQQSNQFQSTVRQYSTNSISNAGDIDYWPGLLLAMAYPDRIAQQRSPNGTQFVLSNGRAAVLQEHDNLRASPFIAIADLGGNKKREDRIFMAAAVDGRCFDDELADLVTEKTTANWDEKTGRFIAEQQRCVGALIIESKTVTKIDSNIRSPAILAMIRKRGLSVLGFDEGMQQWLARIALMASLEQGWPDLSEEALLSTLESWLAPYLDKVNSLPQLKSLDFKTMLTALLPWEQQQRLNQQLPEKITIPTGEGAKIDYQQSPPVLAVRLQEMFGCATSPAVADGRVILLCHLLSPARRPLAVTQDLTSFWANAYQEVKKDMKGRYPKHPWPDDPINAPPTNRAKPRKR